MKTILAPVDFSSATDPVVAEAAALAKAVSGRIVLLTVIQPPAAVADYAPLLQDIAEITAAGEKAAAAKLARLQEKLQADSIESECVQVVGAPVHHIISEAERTAADYIVMGSHGHTALYELLVGSTTHGVLKRAACPVVIVPAAKTGAAAAGAKSQPASA
jgi:nucleotide-binding universal stress UspA family protein